MRALTRSGLLATTISLTLLASTAARADGTAQARSLELTHVSSLKIGGANTAEIGAYDPASRRLFVTNAITQTVSIVSLANPSNPSLVSTIDVSALGGPNSVAVCGNIVAVALENTTDKTLPGRVAFYDTNGTFLSSVTVGALPDMLTFTPDGRHLLVANEAEPSGYGDPALYRDPEGSISVIRMPQDESQVAYLTDASVRTAGFAAFNGQEDALRARGIRLYGPGATAAMDFEPEYVAVTPDSRKAYVTLQENNAVAVVDIRTARVTELLPLGYKDYTTAPYTVATYEWEADRLPSIGRTPAGQRLQLGGFSGLAYEGVTADGKLRFIANTDRGPNGEPTATGQRPFLLPRFTPRLVRFELDPARGTFRLTQQLLLRDANGKPLTGLPNVAVAGGTASTAHNDEIPIDLSGNVLGLDPLGGDFEGVVVDTDGSFWLPDEYRPAIYHFDPEGRLLARYIPIGAHAAAGLPVPAPGVAGELGIEALPAVLAQRRQNRGMEGIALKDGKLYGFVQSPVRNPVSTSNGTLNGLKNVRVVEFDPATLATRQFLYVMDNAPAVTGDADDTRADKIGDAVSVPGGGFLVVERDDDATDSDEFDTIAKKVYAFDLAGATEISAIGLVDVGGGVLRTVDQMTTAELAAAGINAITKTLHVDLAAAGYGGVEKVEGLALLPDGRLAVVNDNDFGVAGIEIDTATGTFTYAPGYVPEPVVLGLVSVPGLDASDRDGPSNTSRINIRNWPVFGMYQPDTIATYSVRGQTYFVTANEGDAREWPGFAEEVRVGAGSVVLDPTLFPDAATLKQNANLGRLTITTQLGRNAAGQYEALYTLGGRSFSIWSATGAQVFDSDAALERLTAATYPANFNASNDNNNRDDRSDNKGPEPEGLALGRIGGRQYAFVGLERIGGIAMWDITSPVSPVFVDYANNRDFTAAANTPQAGDLGPEGVLFVPAEESPNGKPLVIVTNEISGTVATYQVEGQRD